MSAVQTQSWAHTLDTQDMLWCDCIKNSLVMVEKFLAEAMIEDYLHSISFDLIW